MKTKLETKRRWLSIPIACVLLVLAVTNSGCSKIWNAITDIFESHPTTPPVSSTHISVDSNELVVWVDSNDPTLLDNWLTDHNLKTATTQTTYCPNCDSTLVLLKGNDVLTFISGETAPGGAGGKKGGGVSGGDGTVYYSLNFPVELIDTISGDYDPADPNNTGKPGATIEAVSFNQPDITVAVFDTGIDSVQFLNYLYHSNETGCLGPLANSGWNFAGHNDNWKDDHIKKHGSVVAQFIVNEVIDYKKNGVRILPVKVHSKDGQSKLFDVLCGMSYAVDRHAQIINASFGYYAKRLSPDNEPDSSSLLFTKYVEKKLTNNNILLVAAAGNRDDVNENAVYPSTDPVARRNLDSVCFYPASMARYLPNVIAVTTISAMDNTVSPNQNFSPHVVDIGVYADNTGAGSYAFINPRTGNGANTVVGSSFATPIVTGKICANYFMLQSMTVPGARLDKNTVFNLLGSTLQIHHPTALSNRISQQRAVAK